MKYLKTNSVIILNGQFYLKWRIFSLGLLIMCICWSFTPKILFWGRSLCFLFRRAWNHWTVIFFLSSNSEILAGSFQLVKYWYQHWYSITKFVSGFGLCRWSFKKMSYMLNIIITMGKYHVHKSKWNNSKPSLNDFNECKKYLESFKSLGELYKSMYESLSFWVG